MTMQDTTMVTEHEHGIELRAFLARLLGWDDARQAAIDGAICAIRSSLTERVPLVLRGESNLVAIARALHRRVVGVDRPFVMCDPRRVGIASVRQPASYPTSTAARMAAAGGSVCVRTRRLPPDFRALVAALEAPGAEVLLFVCVEQCTVPRGLAQPIDVPPLTTRSLELTRIINEYAREAIALLGAPPESFTGEDHRWVHEQAAGSLAEIEKATLRRVALRCSANASEAAARLALLRHNFAGCGFFERRSA
jgi:hypothetical protein